MGLYQVLNDTVMPGFKLSQAAPNGLILNLVKNQSRERPGPLRAEARQQDEGDRDAEAGHAVAQDRQQVGIARTVT